MESEKTKNAIWIDKDINSKQFDSIVKELEFVLLNFQIYKCKSVSKAFKIIQKKYNEFKFKLVYIIVSEELSEEFIKLYMAKSLTVHFLAATVIFSSKENKEMEKKPFFSDPFLNHGKIVYSFNSLVNYITSIQCPFFLLDGKNICNREEIKVRNQMSNDINVDAQFYYMNNLGEMAYPLLMAKNIKSNLINNNELEEFQKYCIKLYPDLKQYLRPSEEKNIYVPYNILAKYYLHLYTLESNFFRNLNKELSQGKFDKYRQYIFILYIALNKGYFRNCNDCELYRGGTLSEEEYQFLQDKFENHSDKKVLFFSKKFLSFSKKQEVADEFLKQAIEKKYKGVYVRIIVDEANIFHSYNNYSTNIDINKMNLSKYNSEEEVLFLPLSTFEVIDIIEDEFCENKIKIIRLKYLNEYENEMNRELKSLLSGNEESEKKMDDFIKNGLNSKFSEEISKCLDIKINNNLRLEYLMKKKIYKNIFKRFMDSNTLDKIADSKVTRFFSQGIFDFGLKFLGNELSPLLGVGPGLIIAGIAFAIAGVLFGIKAINDIYEKKKEDKKKENEYLKKILFYNDDDFYCDNLYYGYLPEKFRKKYIPSLKWNNKLQKAKSIAIELIVDEDYDNPNFLIINIPGDSSEINEFSLKGDIIINYKGIPENAFSAYFGLYMFDKDKIDFEYFKEKKNRLIIGSEYIENLIFYKISKII